MENAGPVILLARYPMNIWNGFALGLVFFFSGCMHRVRPNVTNQRIGAQPIPIVTERSEPLYSETAREAKLQGVVVLEGIVQADGTFRVLRYLKTLGSGLDENAKLALERWRFVPPGSNTPPLRVEVSFRLQN